MMFNAYLLIFAVAFMGCVLSTPGVTRLAHWAGAIDRPDQFRRIHKGATPRLGGLGLAFGLFLGIIGVVFGGYLDGWSGLQDWYVSEWPVLVASLMVLVIGFIDDTRTLGPRVKLLGQAMAVLVLYVGGVRIQNFDILGWTLDFTHPGITVQLFGRPQILALPSLIVTMFWFLGCMNIWNLIDGMDGLASGVGLLVSGTLTLVAIFHENVGVAITASALAGSLAGFLLYNWHPACIFLGDSGSLLIGLLIGVIGVQGAFKGPSAISILVPILAMGLPITDTALAIFRRWVRHLPLTAADRRHVHHLLISLGLNPRQAALLLYCFSGFLCGVVLLGVALKNIELAFILGISGCLAFLVVLTSRLNELASLRGDLRARLLRGRQERFAAKVTWEAIQRIEVCPSARQIIEIVEKTARTLGCHDVELTVERRGEPLLLAHADSPMLASACGGDERRPVSGAAAIFRFTSGQDMNLTVSLQQYSDAPLVADIAFRFLQKLAQATAERLESLVNVDADLGPNQPAEATAPSATSELDGLDDEPIGLAGRSEPEPLTVLGLDRIPATRGLVGWLRMALRMLV